MRILTGDGTTIFVMAGLFLSLALMVFDAGLRRCGQPGAGARHNPRAEMAIRSAMGAKRSRLLRQMITESIALALMGGAAGVVLGMLASSALSHIDPMRIFPSIFHSRSTGASSFIPSSPQCCWHCSGSRAAFRVARATSTAYCGREPGSHARRHCSVILWSLADCRFSCPAGRTSLFVRSLTAMQTWI